MLTVTDIPVKPRILIADDSRIVRATLIKQIEGMFEFREALDGEQAWEALLLDQSIRVVITDLTMPRLDGYGLLRRIRSSRVSRIRDIPVVVVSGSDEQEEKDRVRAAGANDLIVKGMGTAQLLSRLDVLSQLVSRQSDLERGLEVLVGGGQHTPATQLMPDPAFYAEAADLFEHAQKTRRNFILLSVAVALRSQTRPEVIDAPPAVMEAIGQLLSRTVRSTDHVGRTGSAEFTLAAASINADSARMFGQRVARAIASAHLLKDESLSLIASCGLATLSEAPDAGTIEPLRRQAHARARQGVAMQLTGVIGAAEEKALQYHPGADFLAWLRGGRREPAPADVDRLPSELKPLVELLQQQGQR